MRPGLPILYESTFELRPQLSRAVFAAAVMATAVILALLLFTVSARLFWPTHGILQSSRWRTLLGTAGLSSLFGSFFLLDYPFIARWNWLVDGEGVSVLRQGRVVERMRWDDVIGVSVLPLAVRLYRRDGTVTQLRWTSPGSNRRLVDQWEASRPGARSE